MRARICTQCGAPLGSRMSDCHYCGTSYDARADDDERSFATSDCPRCHVRLQPRRIAHSQIDMCQDCGGSWVTHRTMSQLMTRRRKSDKALRHIEKRQRRPRRVGRRSAAGHLEPIPCPRCHRSMRLEPVQDAGRVYVDVCQEHGTWFDAKELRALLKDDSRRRRRRSDFGDVLQEGALWAVFVGVGEILEEVGDIFD